MDSNKDKHKQGNDSSLIKSDSSESQAESTEDEEPTGQEVQLRPLEKATNGQMALYSNVKKRFRGAFLPPTEEILELTSSGGSSSEDSGEENFKSADNGIDEISEGIVAIHCTDPQPGPSGSQPCTTNALNKRYAENSSDDEEIAFSTTRWTNYELEALLSEHEKKMNKMKKITQ